MTAVEGQVERGDESHYLLRRDGKGSELHNNIRSRTRIFYMKKRLF